ncbi:MULTISPECIES: amino acid adenylation domain-containing protein [unclassified Rhodococcus (in: high G+C Gram-positive bacteria)]|uniref:amino acid adenylation domain-containing protein n=1 Tax=unclassified Rhodococcus (in: high G+C Gram-positive bacteria) TaxID=192944 RepID=UPI00289B3BBF|nr:MULTISPECIES: amino acid adenylation domain-containing protein [unclassified Rhodococcus (in: high G+C Gram-positive bacteria)]
MDGSAADAAARCRRERELRRPVGTNGRGVRAVLLLYSDGVADLVLAADRRDLDATSLATMSDVLTGDLDVEAVSAGPLGEHHDGEALDSLPSASAGRHRFPWAAVEQRSGPASYAFALGRIDGDVTATIIVAAALVLGRYEHRDTVRVAAWCEDRDRPPRVLGSFWHCTVQTVDCSENAVLQEVLRSAIDSLDQDARAPLDTDAAYGPRGIRAVGVGVLGTSGTFPRVARDWLACQSAPLPLTLAPVVDATGAVVLQLHRQQDVVDDEAAQQFGRHVMQMCHQMRGAGTDVRVGDLPMGEQMDSGVGLEVVAPAVPGPGRIEALFRARAKEQPDAIAVVHGHRQLTYAELDEQSRWSAAGLRMCGIRPGDRVGICLDRSVELIVAMLSVLDVGATYVPMDVRHPADRLAYTADDADVQLVVTEVEDPLWSSEIRVISPGELASTGDDATDTDGDGDGLDADAAAYVIYTSGSTGRPKGVMIPHRAVLALFAATTADLRLGREDTWSMFHSSAFDFSVWEIWGALLTGARLVIVPYWISRSPVEFHALLADERVSVLSQTPSAFAQLAEADRELDRLDALRLVVFGGESLDARALLPWMDRYPESGCRLVDMYGTTETTVHVTAHTVTRGDAVAGTRVVGRPLPGWYVFVLDERGRPVPRGVDGEIYVGGAGVALGYLRRPELTAERFLRVPSCGNRRLYRTGDLGRLRRDGTLEHLGRLDTQVQIRGFRVELGEVRSVLLDDPAVVDAAVVSSGSEGAPGGFGLDAYVVLSGENGKPIRQRAQRFLPEYMLPRTITVVDALPLTINGKLDVARLPEPDRPAPRSPAPHVSTPGGLAERLTDIWESVLGVPVAADDNLFELGGNSLCAIKADSMMRRQGLPVLPMRELYLHPSISGICATLDRLYAPPDR